MQLHLIQLFIKNIYYIIILTKHMKNLDNYLVQLFLKIQQIYYEIFLYYLYLIFKNQIINYIII